MHKRILDMRADKHTGRCGVQQVEAACCHHRCLQLIQPTSSCAVQRMSGIGQGMKRGASCSQSTTAGARKAHGHRSGQPLAHVLICEVDYFSSLSSYWSPRGTSMTNAMTQARSSVRKPWLCARDNPMARSNSLSVTMVSGP